MKQANLVLVVAVIAVVIALANVLIVFQKMDDIKTLAGYATDEGTAQLEVLSNVAINFSNPEIDWGAGLHTNGTNNATLNTEGTVLGGNWTIVDTGLILENTGNVNATIDLQAGSDPSTFIGGSEVTPEYKWKISDNETDSCGGTGLSQTSYTTVSDGSATNVCDVLRFVDATDSLLIDIEVVVPQDTPKEEKTDTITATATAI